MPGGDVPQEDATFHPDGSYEHGGRYDINPYRLHPTAIPSTILHHPPPSTIQPPHHPTPSPPHHFATTSPPRHLATSLLQGFVRRR